MTEYCRLTEGNAISLPVRLDTLGAIAFASHLSAVAASGGSMIMDAAKVEVIGLVALQLLAAAREIATRVGKSFAIERCSREVEAAIRIAGLGALLGEEECEQEACGQILQLSFTDDALKFGGEPLDHLTTLAALGARITAVLPQGEADQVFGEPDRIRLRFQACFPFEVAQDDIERELAAFGADCVFHWHDRAPATIGSPPDRGETVPVRQERLDVLLNLVGDLVSSQAGLIEVLGDRRSALGSQLADLDRAVGSLQDAILNISKAPIRDLFSQAVGADRLLLSNGDLELERGIARRIGPALASLLKALRGEDPVPVGVEQEGGLLTLSLIVPAGSAEAANLCDVVRSFGGHGDISDAGELVLRLPQSLMLVDVMLVEVGAGTFAIPVINLVEILRPTSNMLFRIDDHQRLLRFQGQVIPIMALGARLDMEGWLSDPLEAIIVVVRVGTQRIALQVDAVSEQRQVMLSPISGGIAPPHGISGAAILSASRLALVINVAELV